MQFSFTYGKILDTTLCECVQLHTIKHITEICPLTKYKGGIEELHKNDSEAQ